MRTRPLVALLAAGTIALAACGSDNSKSSSSNAPAAAATTAAAAAATTAAAAPTTTAASATTGNDSSYGNAYAVPTTAAAAAPAATGSTAITLADSSLGKIVVDANGMTLYAFLKDSGGTSSCAGACANAWPPATATGTPAADPGITGPLSTSPRAHGTMQL